MLQRQLLGSLLCYIVLLGAIVPKDRPPAQKTRVIYECEQCHANYYKEHPGLCRAIDPSTGDECLSTHFTVTVVRATCND